MAREEPDRRPDPRDARASRLALDEPSGQDVGSFDASEVDHLPEIARRHLLHAIRPGAPLATRVRLQMHGSMRLRPDGHRLPMRASQILVPGRGFVWEAEVGSGLLWFSGHDAFVAERGAMSWSLWGLVPIVRAAGPDVSRSAAGRLAIESILAPAALLPRRGAVWEPIDATTARVRLEIGAEPAELLLTIDPTGRLVRVVTMRWGNPDGPWARTAFGTFAIDDERTFDGYTIPSRLSVGWRPGQSSAFEFFFAEIDAAEFD